MVKAVIGRLQESLLTLAILNPCTNYRCIVTLCFSGEYRLAVCSNKLTSPALI